MVLYSRLFEGEYSGVTRPEDREELKHNDNARLFEIFCSVKL